MKKKTVKSAPASKAEAPAPEAVPATKKPATPRTTPRRTVVKTEAAPAKTTARRAPAKAVKRKVAVQVPVIELKAEDIGLRAYFISEDRRKAGIPGSPEADWVEAERQLRAEAAALLTN